MCCRIWPAKLAQEELSTIRPCCGDGNHLWVCWQQGLAWDHASQGGLRLLPDKGLRSTAPGARAAALGQALEPQSLVEPDSCTKPSTMGSRTCAQSPLPALPWLPGSLLILQPSCSRASQQNSRHKSFLRPQEVWHSTLSDPVGPGSPSLQCNGQKNHWAQTGHTGCASSLAGTV